jgi:hypothetical protein
MEKSRKRERGGSQEGRKRDGEEIRQREEREWRQHELRMREEQWELQKSRDKRESEKQQTPAAQIKFFGSVMKNVMPKFPADAADAPMFFKVLKNCLIVLKCLMR